MKLIDVENSIGTVLCHDLTQIIPGKFKDVRFKKGHIIKKEDIPILLSMGKKHLYVYEIDNNMLHEDEAAEVLKNLCINEYMKESETKEGKIELKSTIRGYFHVDKEKLKKINMINDIIVTTIKNGDVDIDKKVTAVRVVPLVIDKYKLDMVAKIMDNSSVIKIHPYKIKSCAIITTGSEVYNGIIDDKFTSIVENKLLKYGVVVKNKILCDDNINDISNAIDELKNERLDMIICTGGMSVDADDLTPKAIMSRKVNIVTYGSSMLPGAMFLLGYFEDDTPILGLPGCVMYASSTVFDVVLPKILAKIKWTKEELAELSYGGLCQSCKICHFPNCNFGN